MESATDVINPIKKDSEGFFKYITNIDEDSKCHLMNMIQYSVLAIIPSIAILKAVKHFIPNEDDSKGSLEISAECVAQLSMIVLGIWFFDRAIRYVPTYCGVDYKASSPESMLLPLILIMLTMQTKLGAKINILIERLLDLWHGRSSEAVRVSENMNKVNISQPFAGQHQPSQADHLDQSRLLPSAPGMTSMPQMQPQKSPDFNNMYSNSQTPPPNASDPRQNVYEPMSNNEPMAANMMGGSFSTW